MLSCQKDLPCSPWHLLLLTPRAVDTRLGTRHIKGCSRGSKPEVPLSLICLRHPMEWYAGSDLCVDQQEILTPPLWASSTSPVFSAETLGVLIPAGHISSESPCGRKIVKQKEETDTFSAVLRQEAQRQPFRLQKLQVTERALLRDGKPQLAVHGAGCRLHALLWAFIAAACATTAQRNQCKGPGTPWCHRSCSVAGLWGATRYQEHWENDHWVPEACGWVCMDHEWCSYSIFIRRKKQLSEKPPKTCLLKCI